MRRGPLFIDVSEQRSASIFKVEESKVGGRFLLRNTANDLTRLYGVPTQKKVIVIVIAVRTSNIAQCY
jgi:hypothetical protein